MKEKEDQERVMRIVMDAVAEGLLTEKDILDNERWKREEELECVKEEALAEGLSKGEKIGLSKGEKIGLSKGEKIGLSKGEKIGLSKGEKKGVEKNTKDMIKNMIANNLSIDMISKISGKSISEINKIASIM